MQHIAWLHRLVIGDQGGMLRPRQALEDDMKDIQGIQGIQDDARERRPSRTISPPTHRLGRP